MPRKRKKPRKTRIKPILSARTQQAQRPQGLKDVALRTRPALMAAALASALSDRQGRDDHD